MPSGRLCTRDPRNKAAEREHRMLNHQEDEEEEETKQEEKKVGFSGGSAPEDAAPKKRLRKPTAFVVPDMSQMEDDEDEEAEEAEEKESESTEVVIKPKKVINFRKWNSIREVKDSDDGSGP